MPDLHSARARVTEFQLQPLGFYYLHDNQAGGASHRMHIWLPSGPDPTENDQHQHKFDMWSQVLRGALRSEVFHFVEGQSGGEIEFEVTYADGHSILKNTGRVGKLESICTFETGTGGNYFLKAGIIHRAVAVEKPCVTILTAHDRDIRVFAYGNDETEPPSQRRRVDGQEAAQLAELLDSIIAQSPQAP
jgi:hypothetical protein